MEHEAGSRAGNEMFTSSSCIRACNRTRPYLPQRLRREPWVVGAQQPSRARRIRVICALSATTGVRAAAAGLVPGSGRISSTGGIGHWQEVTGVPS